MKIVKDNKYNPGVSRISKFIGKENLKNFESGKSIEIKDKEILKTLIKRGWVKKVKEVKNV